MKDRIDEPYESMPEGQPHAAVDWITRIIAGLLLALIVLVASACPAQAGPIAGMVVINSQLVLHNWCGQWADGFEVGYCWRKAECDYIPPQVCPAPKDGQTDGYVVGLRDGLSEGKSE